MQDNDKFKIIVPAELEKAKNGEWKVRGLASTQKVDQQGEIIIQKGIDLTPIDNKKGVINFDHMKGPENTIGLLDGYHKTEKGLYVEGRLFKNHSKAKAVYEIMSSLGESDKGRVGLSVEGRILERDPVNPKIIKKCEINAVAITLNPVNQETFADLVKSMSGAEQIDFNSTESSEQVQTKEEPIFTAKQVVSIVEKALTAGAAGMKAPIDRSGGEALSVESLDPKKKKKVEKGPQVCWEGYERTPGTKQYEPGSCKPVPKRNKDVFKSDMTNILDRIQTLYPLVTRDDLWRAIKTRMETKFPYIIKGGRGSGVVGHRTVKDYHLDNRHKEAVSSGKLDKLRGIMKIYDDKAQSAKKAGDEKAANEYRRKATEARVAIMSVISRNDKK